MFNNSTSFNAQTIFYAGTMDANNTALSTLMSNRVAGLNIRQSTSNVASYFTGNGGDFLQHQSTAVSGGTLNINGNRRADIPGGFGVAHVLKAERNTVANYSGYRLSDNVVANRRWNGDIGEIIAYDGKLSGDDTLAVQSYFTEKYGTNFNTSLDERITETKQIAVDAFNEGGAGGQIGVNFHYGGPTVGGTFKGIAFDNIDLTGGVPPSGPFALNANAATAGTMLTLNMPFISDNGQRIQNANMTGVDAGTLNAVANEIFYLSNGLNHPTAEMTFNGLESNQNAFVQVLGGDQGWTASVQVLVNGTEIVDWLGAADGNATSTASLLGFYAQADALGQLNLEFSGSSGNYAGIGGLIITLQEPVVPEPASLVLLAVGGAVMMLGRRRRNV